MTHLRSHAGAVLGLAGVLAVAAAAGAPARAGAQAPPRAAARRDSALAPSLPGDVARLVAALYNAPSVTRAAGPYTLPAGRSVTGDLAVIGGPVTIAGTVAGRITVINADLVLQPGARIEGDAYVVGGVLEGRNVGEVQGEIRVYRQPLVYHREGERLVPDEVDDDGDRPSAWWGWRGGPDEENRTYAGFRVATGTNYNRVEGLPILGGGTVQQRFPWGRLRVDALGIYRTEGGWSPKARDLGHDLTGELRIGRAGTVRLAGRLYDEIVPVEDWQLTPLEVGLATFLFHRDYRDYYGRHGGALRASVHPQQDVSLSLSLADERWSSQTARDPAALVRNGQPWRPNPQADEARLHRANATLRVDTRNDADSPWAGWYVLADYERGTGGFTAFAPLSSDGIGIDPLILTSLPAGSPARSVAPGRRTYGRGFLDVRRYNRLGPDAQLNLRVVAGGWLHGDALPAQRRFSASGPGSLPGFDFRAPAGRGGDVGTCSAQGVVPAGSPAQCERLVLTQVEFRNDIRVGLFGSEPGSARPRLRGFRRTASWVVFADAGRGWLLGDRALAPGVDRLVYGRGQLPAPGSWLADVGAGVDFGRGRAVGDVGAFGIYVAKSVSSPDQPANLLLRVRRRF